MSGALSYRRHSSGGTSLSPRTSIISYPCGEVYNALSFSGSGRSPNVPISDEARRGRGKVRPCHHGQETVGHRRCDSR